MTKIDEMILRDNEAICENIDDLDIKSRDKVSQNMLSFFRNLVEHIAIKIYIEAYPDTQINRSTTKVAIDYLKVSYEFYFLRQFHSFLQDSRSHYTPNNDGAERLVLKYYEYLIQIRKLMKEKFDINILDNLEKYPLDLDDTLNQYYEKVVEQIEKINITNSFEERSGRFYLYRTKAFFINKNVYYENTMIPVNDDGNKNNQIVVFSKMKITSRYAVRMRLKNDYIDIDGKLMPVTIMVDWFTSIRPCELKNFGKLFDLNIKVRSDMSEYIQLMNFLSKTGLNLVDLLDSSDNIYTWFRDSVTSRVKKQVICNMLDETRIWIREKKYGSNIVRYLLYILNNKDIKLQLSRNENYKITGLYVKNETIPFEEIPFNSSLYGHNPSFSDLLSCIGHEGHEDEILAHRIKINAESYGMLYTNVEELKEFDDIDELIIKYNSKIYKKHNMRKLDRFGDNVFIKGYEADTCNIIKKLIDYTKTGVESYTAYVNQWISLNPQIIDCDEKEQIIKEMFISSRIAMIYGAAGTGKSTLINHISLLWKDM